MVLLYLFFEYTRMGIAMRAASMNRRAAQLMGVNVGRVALVAWGLATAISVVSGFLVAPLTFLDFEMMFAVLLKAFAGAILGGFNSLPGAVVGCLVIGVVENLFAAYVSTAFKDTFAFGLIILVLMFRPQGLFTRRIAKKGMSLDIRTIGGALVLLLLLGLPFGLGNYGYYILATVMIYAMVALSLNVLIGMGGQISIGHAGFWALGAYASALSVIKLGLPFSAGRLPSAAWSRPCSALSWRCRRCACRGTISPSRPSASRCSSSRCSSNGSG